MQQHKLNNSRQKYFAGFVRDFKQREKNGGLIYLKKLLKEDPQE